MNLDQELLQSIQTQIDRHPLTPKEKGHYQTIIAEALASENRVQGLADCLSWVSGSRIRESDEPPSVQECEVFEGVQLTESAFNAEKGVLDIVILKPGLNRAGKRYYTKEAIQESAPKFKGVKMYADHPSKSETRDRPERSVRDFVAVVTETFVDEQGWLRGKAQVIEDWMKSKIGNLQETGLLHTLGVSHNSTGRFTWQKIENKTVQFVESILTPHSVDFVTEAGAGGSVSFMESDSNTDDPDTDQDGGLNMDEKQELETMKESLADITGKVTVLTETLEGVKTENDTLKAENEKLQSELQESKRREFDAHVETKLAEADVPDNVKKKLVEDFKESTDTEAFDKALADQIGFVQSIKESYGIREKKVKGLGPGNHDTTTSTENTGLVNLSEAFQNLPGIDENLAKSMAGIRR